uniref:Peptidase A1 domain-containing protein n=1 Tax=Rhizophora mucronata TaxID=61149 RepID=A0A2P2J6A0_RHIMU
MLWWDGSGWGCDGPWQDISSLRHGFYSFRSFPQFLDGNSPYYNIELKELHVGGKPLKLKPKIFDGKHGTVLDSGTTYAYLPEEAFLAFKDAIMKEIRFLKQIHGPDPNYNDICFSGAGREVSQLSKIFPEVNMVFSSGQKLSLSPENYLFRHTRVSGAYCLGIFQNGKDPTTLLGGIVVRNTLVTYDRKNDKIGFWKTNCSELWKRLQNPSVPAEAPVVFPHGNTSELAPPIQAPSGLPSDILPGEFRIGIITFDMLISVNNSDMKPNLTEVAVFIAHELKVYNSQVHMLNFTSTGKSYLVKWGVFPAGSADYISKTTAMNIILQLREHRIQFPEKFGSYELLEWNVEPQRKLTWWQQHFLSVAIGLAVTLVMGLLGIGLWLIWTRRKQAFGTYKPIGAIVPEQELPPL